MRTIKRTPENVRAAKAMLKSGSSKKDTAKHFGISRTTLMQWTDPAYYKRHKAYVAARETLHPERSRERYAKLTDEQRAKILFQKRHEYQQRPKVQRHFIKLVSKATPDDLRRVELSLRWAVMGHARRLAPVHTKLMEACTGMTEAAFSEKFDRVEPMPPLVIPPSKLVDPHTIARELAEYAESKPRNPDDAIVRARAFIERQLRNGG